MILVTGGAGFIGANFVLDWRACSDEAVVNLDKLTYAGNLGNLSALRSDPGHIFVRGDIADRELVSQLLATHQPRAIVWHIAPPYDRNWNFVRLLREMRCLDPCVLVLTTTHKTHLDRLAGQDPRALEITGKPYDLEVIVNAVVEGLNRQEHVGPRQFGQPR